MTRIRKITALAGLVTAFGVAAPLAAQAAAPIAPLAEVTLKVNPAGAAPIAPYQRPLVLKATIPGLGSLCQAAAAPVAPICGPSKTPGGPSTSPGTPPPQ